MPRPSDLEHFEPILKQADPAALATLPDEGVELQRVVQLRFELDSARTGLPDARPRRSPVRLAGALALAVAAIFALIAFGPGGSDLPSQSPAAQALDAAAGIATAQAAAPDNPSVVSYRRVKSTNLVTTVMEGYSYSYALPQIDEVWARSDGSGRILRTSLGFEWPTARDKALWESSGSPSFPSMRDSGDVALDLKFDAGELNAGDGYLPPTRDLPTDEDALRQILLDAAAEDGELSAPRMFEMASSVMFEAGATPELRALLYRILADTGGIELDGPAVDPNGRTGTQVSITDSNGLWHGLIFDSETSQPLARSTRVAGPTDGLRDIDSEILEQEGEVPDLRSRPSGG